MWTGIARQLGALGAAERQVEIERHVQGNIDAWNRTGQATQRLEGHRGAARDPRRAPGGSGVLPAAEVRLLASHPADRTSRLLRNGSTAGSAPCAGAQPTTPLAMGALSGATTPPAGSTVTISLCADSTEVPRLNASPSRGFGPSRPSEMGWSPICAHSW